MPSLNGFYFENGMINGKKSFVHEDNADLVLSWRTDHGSDWWYIKDGGSRVFRTTCSSEQMYPWDFDGSWYTWTADGWTVENDVEVTSINNEKHATVCGDTVWQVCDSCKCNVAATDSHENIVYVATVDECAERAKEGGFTQFSFRDTGSGSSRKLCIPDNECLECEFLNGISDAWSFYSFCDEPIPTLNPTSSVEESTPPTKEPTRKPVDQSVPLSAAPSWSPTTSFPTPKPTERSLPPEFRSFQIEAAFVGARALFSSMTNKANLETSFDCSKVFVEHASFGADATCTWIDSKEIRVQFGSLPTISLGDEITLVDQLPLLSADGRSIPATGFVASSGPPGGFQEPTAVILGPSTIGICTNITLNGATSTGNLGRPLTYTWIAFINNVEIKSGDQSTLFIPYHLYDIETTSQIVTQMTVKNHVDAVSSTEFVVSVLNEEIPTITFLGNTEITVTIDQEIEVAIRAELLSCGGGASYQTSYQWSLKAGSPSLNFDITLPNARNLLLTPNQLLPNQQYVFQVQATISGTSSSGEVTINTKYPLPLVKSAAEILINSFQDITILPSDLFQFPDGVTLATEYTFEWSISSQDCDSSNKITDSSTPSITFAEQVLHPDCTYVLQLQLTVDGNDLISMLTLDTIDRPTTKVTIYALTVGLLNPTGRRIFEATAEMEGEYEFTWSILNLDANVKTTTLGNQFVVDGGAFDPFPAGASFSIKVEVNDLETGTRGQTSFGVQINTPPSGGACFPDRESGEAFERFKLRCEGWTSPNPLTYNFRSISSGSGFYLGRFVESNELEVQLSSGVHRIRGVVRDSLGLETYNERSTFTIEVSEATAEAATAYLDNIEDELSAAVAGADLSIVAEIALNSKSAAESLADKTKVLEVQEKMVAQLVNLNEGFGEDITVSAAVQTVEMLSFVLVADTVSEDAQDSALSLAQSIIESVGSQTSASEQNEEQKVSVALPVLDLAANLQNNAVAKNDSSSNENLGDVIKTTMQTALFLTIDNRIAGESFEYSPVTTKDQAFPDIMSAAKLDFKEPAGPNNVDVPSAVDTDDDTVVEMVTMQSAATLDTIPLNSDASDEVAPIVSIDFFSSNPFRRTRRRLTMRESLSVRNLSECAPLTFKISTNSNPDIITMCKFFDTDKQEWSSEGCISVNQTANWTTCACTHATSFSAAAKSFEPQIQTLTVSDFRNLDQMFNYPAPLITCLMVLLVSLILCAVTPETKSRPILASSEVLPRGEKRLDLYGQSEEGKMMKILMCQPNFQKVNNLWLFKFRNEHVLFSLFIRHTGTNYSTHQRILGLTVWIYVILLSSAIFFEQNQNSAFGEVFWMLAVGFIADIPVGTLEYLFRGSRSPNFNPHRIMVTSLANMEGEDMDEMMGDSEPSNLQSHNVQLGVKVKYSAKYGDKMGTVMYVGEVEFRTGIWVGVEWDEPLGLHDGIVEGKRYYNCKPNHGSMIHIRNAEVVRFSGPSPAAFEAPLPTGTRSGEMGFPAPPPDFPQFSGEGAGEADMWDRHGQGGTEPDFAPGAGFDDDSDLYYVDQPPAAAFAPGASHDSYGAISSDNDMYAEEDNVQHEPIQQWQTLGGSAFNVDEALLQALHGEETPHGDLEDHIRNDMNTRRQTIGADELSKALQTQDQLDEDWDRLNKKKAYAMLSKHFQLRKGLLRFRYPFRPYWKRVAWGIGIFVGICCSILVTTYGVRFDIQAQKEIDPGYVEAFESKCELSQSHEEKKNFGINMADLNIAPEKPKIHPFSLPEGLSVTERWLISNIVAILEGWFFSEPILAYIMSIWAVVFEIYKSDDEERPSFSEFFSCKSRDGRRLNERLRDPSHGELKRALHKLEGPELEMYTFWNSGLSAAHQEAIRKKSTAGELYSDAERVVE